MAQTLVDRKIARTAPGLPAFLNRRIVFKESSVDDRPSIVSYSVASSNKPQNKRERLEGEEGFDVNSLQMEWPKVGRIGAGLRNLGNTCFINSVLQCLAYCVPLNNYLVQTGSCNHRGNCLIQAGLANTDHCMLCELGRLFNQMMNSQQPVVPSGIVQRLKAIARHFKPGRQEDAHEFLRYLVDSLQKSAIAGLPVDAPLHVKEHGSVIHKVFGGRLRSCITCASCQARSVTHDPVLDISLEVRGSGQQEGFSLLDAFDQFIRKEQLSKSNRYQCESCGQLCEASKQLMLEGPPPVLTLHLKRFAPSAMGVGKLTRNVTFFPDLGLSNYFSAERESPPVTANYSLYAVLVHDGQSVHSGHYYAFVKAANSLWYCMNDDSVCQVSLSTVLKQRAYLLFYQRASIIGNTEKTHEDMVRMEEVVVDLEGTSSVSSLPRSSTMWHTTPLAPANQARAKAMIESNKKRKWNVSSLK